MKYLILLASSLVLFLFSCIDYIRLEDEGLSYKEDLSPPIIDMSHISPHPLRLIYDISVGKNCKGQTFKVPPIDDSNLNDRLYYIWFLDNRLLSSGVIESENRASAILTLTIDEQFLLSHFENKVPPGYFKRTHAIEFLVSDLPYTIPESRFIDNKNGNEKKHGDYAYWIVTFSDEDC